MIKDEATDGKLGKFTSAWVVIIVLITLIGPGIYTIHALQDLAIVPRIIPPPPPHIGIGLP